MAILSRATSGIYEIRNTINGHCYIGSTRNFSIRFYDHKKRLESGIHRNKYLQNAWNKYGESCFVFSIIECCELSELIQREQFYIDTRKPKYNIAKDAQRFGVGQIISEKRKKEIGQSKLGNKYWLGRHHSDETKKVLSEKRMGKKTPKNVVEKIKKALIGNKYRLGIPHTDDAKRKISEAGKGRIPWNKGKLAWNKGKPSPQKGKKLTDDVKKKMSEAKKKWWEEKKRANK